MGPFSVSMCEQLDLYGKDQRQEKCFLTRALGKVLKLCGNKQLVSEKLTVIFQSTVHQEKAQQHACAKAFGTCAGNFDSRSAFYMKNVIF